MFSESPRQAFVQSKRVAGRPERMRTELQHLTGGRQTRIIIIDLIRFRSLFAIPPSVFDWHRQQQRGGGFRDGDNCDSLTMYQLSTVVARSCFTPVSNQSMHLFDIEAHKVKQTRVVLLAFRSSFHSTTWVALAIIQHHDAGKRCCEPTDKVQAGVWPCLERDLPSWVIRPTRSSETVFRFGLNLKWREKEKESRIHADRYGLGCVCRIWLIKELLQRYLRSAGLLLISLLRPSNTDTPRIFAACKNRCRSAYGAIVARIEKDFLAFLRRLFPDGLQCGADNLDSNDVTKLTILSWTYREAFFPPSYLRPTFRCQTLPQSLYAVSRSYESGFLFGALSALPSSFEICGGCRPVEE
ncbi:hypothetical protein C8J56DRAFT_901738 [Mycena floridula]|nr:hypothetical protein C8J56DRAFT_901738 [Mycena floridula]